MLWNLKIRMAMLHREKNYCCWWEGRNETDRALKKSIQVRVLARNKFSCNAARMGCQVISVLRPELTCGCYWVFSRDTLWILNQDSCAKQWHLVIIKKTKDLRAQVGDGETHWKKGNQTNKFFWVCSSHIGGSFLQKTVNAKVKKTEEKQTFSLLCCNGSHLGIRIWKFVACAAWQAGRQAGRQGAVKRRQALQKHCRSGSMPSLLSYACSTCTTPASLCLLLFSFYLHFNLSSNTKRRFLRARWICQLIATETSAFCVLIRTETGTGFCNNPSFAFYESEDWFWFLFKTRMLKTPSENLEMAAKELIWAISWAFAEAKEIHKALHSVYTRGKPNKCRFILWYYCSLSWSRKIPWGTTGHSVLQKSAQNIHGNPWHVLFSYDMKLKQSWGKTS